MNSAEKSNAIYQEYEKIYGLCKNDIQRFTIVAQRLNIHVKEVIAELDDRLNSEMLLVDGQNVAP